MQEPERVNPLPMEQAIPGYIPESRLDAHRTLAANQDAYPSIVMSNDGRVVYCAFDSLYSTELSQLIGGIVERSLGIPREMRITRPGSPDEAVELLGAVNRRRSSLQTPARGRADGRSPSPEFRTERGANFPPERRFR